jgi:AhpD family alkylhydroperoxidase
MADIELAEGIPGITGPMMKYPETAQHLRGLAEALLRGPSSLRSAERELIATHVSAQNNCLFCTNSHAVIARHLYGSEEERLIPIVSRRDLSIFNFPQAEPTPEGGQVMA